MAGRAFISMQNHLNLLYREEEREMLPLCRNQGVGVIPWSPLARGRLARAPDEATNRSETDKFGKVLYRKSADADRMVKDRLGEIAAERALPRAQVALAWVMGKPEVSAPIVGATKVDHIRDAVAAVEVILSPEEVSRLEEPYQPHAVAGFA